MSLIPEKDQEQSNSVMSEIKKDIESGNSDKLKEAVENLEYSLKLTVNSFKSLRTLVNGKN